MTATSDQPSARTQRTLISVDAMGGDQGPAIVVAGCSASALKNPDISFILHGPAETLEPLVAKRPELKGRCTIRDAQGVVTMDDKPSNVVRNGKDTSMWSAIESVRDNEASVAVSCGNTGALMALSMIRLKKLPGVNRPAIAVLYPSTNPQGFNVLLDEEHKGRTELKEAHELIRDAADDAGFEFVGFVEGGDISGDVADVIVTDGFTGNIAIKTGEGTATLIGNGLRQAFKNSIWSRAASLLAYTSLRRVSKRFDPRRVNGGVFLGLNGTVVKSHGAADATGVSSAIKLAARLAESEFTNRLAARVAAAKPTKETEE